MHAWVGQRLLTWNIKAATVSSGLQAMGGTRTWVPLQLLSCCHTGWGFTVADLSSGSAVKHLVVKGTAAQLQAVLLKYSALCSLDLDCHGLPEGIAKLIHFQHIHSLNMVATDISRLESLHTLTHLEQLEVTYDVLLKEDEVPHLPCTDFSRLTSLQVETEWQEPQDTFLHLTQLQTLRHLSLCTAPPSGFHYAALSLLTSLHMDRFDLENLELLQELPQLVDLDLLGHPSDAEILMLANLTNLTALMVESIDYTKLKCHLSSVVKLSSLVNLESLHCELVDGDAHYHVHVMFDVTDAVEAHMIVSIPDAPFYFALL